jgi:hypothetical protein
MKATAAGTICMFSVRFREQSTSRATTPAERRSLQDWGATNGQRTLVICNGLLPQSIALRVGPGHKRHVTGSPVSGRVIGAADLEAHRNQFGDTVVPMSAAWRSDNTCSIVTLEHELGSRDSPSLG